MKPRSLALILYFLCSAAAFAQSSPGAVNAASYGAVCNGTAGVDGPAIQAALNTGNNVYLPKLGGNCNLTGASIVMTAPGQVLFGDGRGATRVTVTPTTMVGSISGTTLTVTTAPVGVTLGPNAGISGYQLPSGLYITANGTGTGGTGTYTISASLTVAGGTTFGVLPNRGTIVIAPANDNVIAPRVRDIGFWYTQPDVTTVAGMNTYPPTISAEKANYPTLEGLGIYGAWDAIDMGGNFDTLQTSHPTFTIFRKGHATLTKLDIQAWHRGIIVDGFSDLFRVSIMHWWSFTNDVTGGSNYGDLTSNQFQAWYAQGSDRPVGIYANRVDGLWIDNTLFLGGLGIYLGVATDGVTGSAIAGPYVDVVHSDLDTLSGIDIEAGGVLLSWTGGTVSVGNPQTGPTQAITIAAGNAIFDAVQMNLFADNGYPLIAQTGGYLKVSNSVVLLNAIDESFVTNNGGSLSLVGDTIIHAAKDGSGTRYSNPIVYQGTGAATISGVTIPYVLNANGVFLNLTTDNGDTLSGNELSSNFDLFCPNGVEYPYTSGCPSLTSSLIEGGNGQWTPYTPAITSTGGSGVTFSTLDCAYNNPGHGKTLDYRCRFIVNYTGSVPTQIDVPLPSPFAANQVQALAAINLSTGIGLSGFDNGEAIVRINGPAGGSIATATGQYVAVSGTLNVQ